jgi:phosphate/sulfate permease
VQILRGKLLYRDLWYPYGPLEPYLAAALLWVFGQHLSVFYLFGLTLAIACALLSFNIGKILAGRAVGLTVAAVVLLQGFQGSIFNYIFPYAYAATLGLMLALLCMLLALRHMFMEMGTA